MVLMKRIATVIRNINSIRFVVLAVMVLASSVIAQNKTFPIKSQKATIIEQSAPDNFVARGIKWEETFASSSQPVDWQVIDVDGSGAAWDYRQIVNFTGGGTVLPEADTSFWFSNFNNANAAGLIDEWLISPRLPLIESGDSLHFYAGAIAGNFDDSLKVWISTTDSLPGSFTQIGYFKVQGPVGAWHRYSFDLSAFAGSRVFVAVNYYIVDGGPAGAHSDNVWVDHFILENSGTTGISDIAATIDDFSLSQNYPNPFNPSTTIEYFLKEQAGVNLAVYNILGEEIISLVHAPQAAGPHSVVWNGKDKLGKDVAGGIYFYKLKAGDFEQTRRMLLLK